MNIPNYIGLNETRYSSEDLNTVLHEYRNWLLEIPPNRLGIEWQDWEWRVAHSQAPISIRTWEDPDLDEVQNIRLILSGHRNHRVGEPGPWYVESCVSIYVLSPDSILETEGPLTALSHPGLDYLPADAVAQILAKAIPLTGMILRSKYQIATAFDGHDELGTLKLSKLFVSKYNTTAHRVRVLPEVKTKQSFIERLMDLYYGKVAAFGETSNWKLWTLAKFRSKNK